MSSECLGDNSSLIARYVFFLFSILNEDFVKEVRDFLGRYGDLLCRLRASVVHRHESHVVIPANA